MGMFLRSKVRSLLPKATSLNVNSFMKMRYVRNTTQEVRTEGSGNPLVGLSRVEYDQGLTEADKQYLKRFDIYRFDPENTDSPKKIVSYYVDLQDCGPMVLDALIKIKDEIDPTLTFRRSCREGICGSCSMNIDGRNTLACLSYITTNNEVPLSIYPLPYFSVLKDLVVDMTNFYMQYKLIHPVLMRKTDNSEGQKEYHQSEEDRAKLDGLYECILCACCQSNCPSYWWRPGDYYGPAGLMAAYRWIIDSRDEYMDERLEKLSGQKLERCYQIGACSLTCPKGLDPRAAIEKLKYLYSDYKKSKRQSLSV